MKLKRKSDGQEYRLIWPKILPTKEQMQEHDMTGIFVTMTQNEMSDELDSKHIIYAPFADNFDYELINEEGDTLWTI